MDFCEIYVITNTINGKQYVGQTWQGLEKRWNRHCWSCTQKSGRMVISTAINKYGKESFTREVVARCLTQEDADEKEIEWSERLNTLSPNGYNLKVGQGRGRTSELTKQKISQSNMGRVVSEETRQKLSESHKGNNLSSEAKRKLSEHMKANPISEEWREKLSKASSVASAKHYQFISPEGAVVEIYNMRSFCKEQGLTPSKMSNVSTGKRTHHKGWRRASPTADF